MLPSGHHEMAPIWHRALDPAVPARRSWRVPNKVHRGVTLLEILIVLALIIASAAVAIPAMTNRFENTRFDATIDQLVATLALARAESQRQRRPVQILWDSSERSVYAAWLESESTPDAEEEEGPADSRGDSGQTDSTMNERLSAAGAESKALGLGGSRLRVVVPEGCRVEVGLEGTEGDPDSAEPAARADAERWTARDESQPVSLVVYMPDGSTLGEASFRFVDSRDRQARIEVNRWTGQAVVTRLESASASETLVGGATDAASEASESSDGGRR